MLDRRIELLRILDQVGTITEAAHLLCRSPSGYSRQLRGLAHELGVELLEQHGRKVRLTPAAQRVVAYAHNTQAAWEQTKSSLTEETGVGTLRLGAHPTALSALIASDLEQLSKLHPHQTVQLSESEAPHCFDQLIAGHLDACIIPARADVPPASDGRFHQSTVATEPIDALVPSYHRVSQSGRRVELKELSESLWVLPGPDRSGHQEVLSACHTAGFTPEAIHYVQDTQTVADLVEATGAVSLTSRFSTYQSAAVRVPLDGNPAPHRHLLLCTPMGAEAGQSIQTLTHLVSALLTGERKTPDQSLLCSG